MKKNREELDALIAQVKEVLSAKDLEIKMRVEPVITYISEEFRELKMQGLSFLKRVETDTSSDSSVLLQYKDEAVEIIIEINKIVL